MDERLRNDVERFSRLTYDGFRALATDPHLSRNQKIGFPDAYRDRFEESILEDMRRKLAGLDRAGAAVLDIGCGCSDLPRLLGDHAERHGQTLTLIDSEEQLALIADVPHVRKLPGRFPSPALEEALLPVGFHAIIVYSVIQYVFEEGSIFDFLDAAVRLLVSGGSLLVGDIPNVSMRRRFFASEAGIRFHQEFMQTSEVPAVPPFCLDRGKIDDGVLLGLVGRYRSAGFDAYLLPQPDTLPMHNRREDLLIVRH